MKRKISDLLDVIREDGVDLKVPTPLSTRRIKEKTMGKVEQKKTGGFRWLTRVAAVAAAIAALTITVFAADVVLNEGALFDSLFGITLSDDQIGLMDDIGRTFGKSVSSNGATITPIQAVADETTYFLRLRAEAPEGVVLPDIQEDEGYFYYFASKNMSSIQIEYRENQDADAQWKRLYISHVVTVLPDEDPTDNVKEFVIKFYNLDEDFALNGSFQKRLTIPGLFIHKGRDPYCETLFTGTFTFDISINNENRREQTIVVDTGGASFYNEEYDYTTTVNEVRIYPLHIEIDYTHTTPNNKYIFPYGGPVQIVMKDGSVVEAIDAYFDATTQTVVDPDDVAGVCLTSFNEPIVVESIDYIMIGEEHIFDVN